MSRIAPYCSTRTAGANIDTQDWQDETRVELASRFFEDIDDEVWDAVLVVEGWVVG